MNYNKDFKSININIVTNKGYTYVGFLTDKKDVLMNIVNSNVVSLGDLLTIPINYSNNLKDEMEYQNQVMSFYLNCIRDLDLIPCYNHVTGNIKAINRKEIKDIYLNVGNLCE